MFVMCEFCVETKIEAVFSDIVLSSLEDIDRHFLWSYCLHLWGCCIFEGPDCYCRETKKNHENFIQECINQDYIWSRYI